MIETNIPESIKTVKLKIRFLLMFLLLREIAYIIFKRLLLFVALIIANAIIDSVIPSFCCSRLSKNGSISVTPTIYAREVTPAFP